MPPKISFNTIRIAVRAACEKMDGRPLNFELRKPIPRMPVAHVLKILHSEGLLIAEAASPSVHIEFSFPVRVELLLGEFVGLNDECMITAWLSIHHSSVEVMRDDR